MSSCRKAFWFLLVFFVIQVVSLQDGLFTGAASDGFMMLEQGRKLSNQSGVCVCVGVVNDQQMYFR